MFVHLIVPGHSHSLLTELMAMVFFFPVTKSMKEAATTQHPQPPSPHILFVPVRPGCALIHSFRLTSELAPSTVTGCPFIVNDTLALGEGGATELPI